MDEEPSQPADPQHAEPRDAAAHAGDLARMAEASDDATFGDEDAAKTRVPGILSGDVGPKGKVAAQLRGLSRHERATYGEVPRGTTSSGGFAYLLLPMLAFAIVVLGLVALLAWVASR